MTQKIAVIIGAGPAGLTAAYELLEKTDIKPIVFEMTDDVGGICRTVDYKGNRIDIGGHRFFSKSDQVLEWWKKFIPLQGWSSLSQASGNVPYRDLEREGPDPEKNDMVMLLRLRYSRIFFLNSVIKKPVQCFYIVLCKAFIMNNCIHKIKSFTMSYGFKIVF